MADLKKMTDWEKLQGMLAKGALDKRSASVDEDKLLEHLRSRVKGQDEVIKDVSKLIRLS